MKTKSFKCVPDSELSVPGLSVLSQATLVTDLTGNDSAANESAKTSLTDVGPINKPAQVCRSNSSAFDEARELKPSMFFLAGLCWAPCVASLDLKGSSAPGGCFF